MESHLKKYSCWNKKYFGLILDSNLTVKINCTRKCSSDYYLTCGGNYRSNTALSTSLNSLGELYMEDNVSEPNQIAHTIFNKFHNQNYPYVFSIIKWKQNKPIGTIKLVIKEVIRRYIRCYAKSANDSLNKYLHQLTMIELDSLNKILPFDLKLLEVERNKFIYPPIIIKEIINSLLFFIKPSI